MSVKNLVDRGVDGPRARGLRVEKQVFSECSLLQRFPHVTLQFRHIRRFCSFYSFRSVIFVPVYSGHKNGHSRTGKGGATRGLFGVCHCSVSIIDMCDDSRVHQFLQCWNPDVFVGDTEGFLGEVFSNPLSQHELLIWGIS